MDKGTRETWQKTMDLRSVRYQQPTISGRNGPDAYDGFVWRTRIEQLWQCLETGKTKWEPIEEVTL